MNGIDLGDVLGNQLRCLTSAWRAAGDWQAAAHLEQAVYATYSQYGGGLPGKLAASRVITGAQIADADVLLEHTPTKGTQKTSAEVRAFFISSDRITA
jgi:hypothetical protein